MADTSLQERLRDHAKAFDGLLSLIPAKMYYGEDNSEQWKKKKQTKDEAKAAKRGKLDPDSELNRSAKEVLDERVRNKRKLRELEAQSDEEMDDDNEAADDSEDIEGVERERPGEGLKKIKKQEPAEGESTPKKAKLSADDVATPSATTATPNAPLSDKKKATEEKKLAKKLKAEAKKSKSEKPTSEEAQEVEEAEVQASTEVDADQQQEEDTEMADIDVSGLEEDDSAATSTPNSPVFDSQEAAAKNASAEPASTTTSISSAVTPSERPRHIKIPADTTALRVRLAAKIEALRAARKVDDADGTPIRTRSELIEARREKQAQRKAHKREMRERQREEEDRKREEALASARNSPNSMLSPLMGTSVVDPADDPSANNFSFGRLAFADGTQMAHDLSYEKADPSLKKKGPSDPKTALLKFENQKKRIAALDDDKRKEVLEKETWLAARRRAEGEKVHDDEGLLKKAVKRKEKAKKKSEREWKERAKGVEDGIKKRQNKREENIRKRKEEKGGKGKGKKKGVATAKKSRPGFEGAGFGGKGKK
ncbi:surfeit locus protein 6-domain-containing protein [Bombardia bombarda]|uniref:Surfeit locus protein 6-domain-containing protein n=1 Tax=Bombardia bombarda TaxID=252184 RepID=A0AA39X1P8_9PEZI|nr:surfeit locus protein 6-domain-containing protein [Bombardia bombarda]